MDEVSNGGEQYNDDEVNEGDFQKLVGKFFNRISARDLRIVPMPGTEDRDTDIVNEAMEAGFSLDVVTNACILARRRLEGQTNLDFINANSGSIAAMHSVRYKPIEGDLVGNPNLN